MAPAIGDPPSYHAPDATDGCESDAGEPIAVRGKDGADVARGLSAYGAEEVERIRGLHTRDIARRLGYESGGEVVHCDDLVLI